MSLATTYRFEAIGENKALKSALKRQQERIQEDEFLAERERQAKVESRIAQKSAWAEALEEAAAVKTAKNNKSLLQRELAMSRKAAIMVRRAELRNQLQKDYKLYEEELNKTGKAFYIKRE